ncbi:MFS transporter [uncultured Parasphingorhabdus sp.]|uniref:MFS transporter n=1 Tax=uncultured Parasphingorhabdus sp. TaxID=2709694 RepID=UPI0030D9F4D9|tara:strand:+ start:40064 stop:41278 length:1215 start_codon:yes stop_codon:yes gene_type:complete
MSNPESIESNPPARISELKLFLFALSSAAVVANAYYIHPLITPVAEEFGVSGATIGLAPALNQIALALGILLLLPLGDRINNRKLVTIFVAGQFLAMLAMALSGSFTTFVAASSLLGFVTIAPYLLPAYVTRRVAPGRIGHVTGIMTAGVTLGILGSRVGGGLLGHYFGWRSAYWVGAACMAFLVILLPSIMERRQDEEPSGVEPPRYGELLRSLWPIMKSLPEVPLGGLIQALSFGLFLAIWLAVGLHLPRNGYGVDTVGYLAIIAIVNVLGSPFAGRLADHIGAERARIYFSLSQLIGVCLLPFAGQNLWLLVIAIIFNSIGGASVDICSRTILFSRAPEIRTRLMTIYIVIMFIGGGISSWLGAATYEYAGWSGISIMAICYALTIMGLSLWGLRFRQDKA